MTDAAPTRSTEARTIEARPSFTLHDDAAPYSLATSAWLREAWSRRLEVVLDDDWFVDSDRELLSGLPKGASVLQHTELDRWKCAFLE